MSLLPPEKATSARLIFGACSNLFRCNNFALITCLSQSESSPSNTSRTPRDPPGTCMWCVGSTVGRGRLAGGANGIWSDPCERSLFVRSSSFALSASFSRLNISSCICRMIRSLLPLSHNLEQDLHQHQVHTFQSSHAHTNTHCRRILVIGSLCVTVLVSLRLTELQSRRSAAIRRPESCERCAEPGARAVIAAAGVATAFGKRAPAVA